MDEVLIIIDISILTLLLADFNLPSFERFEGCLSLLSYVTV